MAGQDYTYVNGEGPYQGNILLDPDGTVTRAELYDAITKKEAEELIGTWVTEERTALSVVRAKEAVQ